jgi:CDP-diacylglycerol pyrophosphatase
MRESFFILPGKLSPAYDMVATKLVNPADDEDVALTLNGKKKKLKHKDFVITPSIQPLCNRYCIGE